MSRSGYTDDCGDEWSLIRWRGAVASSIRGRRGQAFLREMLDALGAIPIKRLIDRDWENLHGVCALGAVAHRRGVDLSSVDPEDTYEARDQAAQRLDIAPALAAEIMYVNDEDVAYWRHETPEQRWERVRAWVVEQIR